MDAPRHRQESPPHVLRIDAEFHGMSHRLRRLANGQRQPVSHPKLLHHQINAGRQLRHRMLDLQPRVHLQEGNGAVAAHQKLHRARAHIAGLCTDVMRGPMDALALHVRQERRRRLLHQLLVATLQRTVPRAQHHHMALRIGHHLRFHVARLIQILLHEALAPTEGRGRLAHRRRIQLGHLVHLPGHLQPAATAAERRLDGNGQPMLTCERQHLVNILHRTGCSRHQRCPHRCRNAPCRHLVAQLCNGLGPGTDPHQPGIDHRLRKPGILRQEAIARMYCVGPAASCNLQQLAHIQVGIGRTLALQAESLISQTHMQRIPIHIGIYRHALHTIIGTCTDDAHRNLTAVGNQDFLDHHFSLVRRPSPSDTSILYAPVSRPSVRLSVCPSACPVICLSLGQTFPSTASRK